MFGDEEMAAEQEQGRGREMEQVGDGAEHGEEEVRQPGVVVYDSGVGECGDVGAHQGGADGGVDGRFVAALHREQVRFWGPQQDIQRDLQAESGGREDGQDSKPEGGDQSVA